MTLKRCQFEKGSGTSRFFYGEVTFFCQDSCAVFFDEAVKPQAGVHVKVVKEMPVKAEKYIEQKVGRVSGFAMPEGYMERMRGDVMGKLPPYPEAPRAVKLSAWQRVKPYVYLAAMFAGIWCTMKIFHDMSNRSAELSLDNPPALVAEAMQSSDYSAEWYVDDVYDIGLQDEVAAQYGTIENFEAAFGYDFEPEYASIDVDVSERS